MPKKVKNRKFLRDCPNCGRDYFQQIQIIAMPAGKN